MKKYLGRAKGLQDFWKSSKIEARKAGKSSMEVFKEMMELRNKYGSGHGKSSSYKGLQERHAKLAIGASITLVNFLWDSNERINKNIYGEA